MIIKNITIQNFRSYYGFNSFDIGDKLTLIIGSNGDGKTTFFEALEWLFDTSGVLPKADQKFISKKKAAELIAGNAETVKVSMTYVTNGSKRITEKSFKFSKDHSGEISVSRFEYILHFQNGVENEYKEGESAIRMFDRDFSPYVRKYSLFKGEQELNIFNNKDAMKYLVETFSQVRDFDPYIKFMKEATRFSGQAYDAAVKSDKKNSKEADKYRALINCEEQYIHDYTEERRTKISEAQNFQALLDDMERNKDASSQLKDVNERLDSLRSMKAEKLNRLNENYTFRLLDEMWILMGFQPVAEEFRVKVSELDRARRKMQSEYDRKVGAERLASQIQNELCQGHVPLAINVPDENTMREMLDEEICKVCGRPAPKGTDAYNYMKQRLDAFLSATKEVEEEEVPDLFEHDFIRELNAHYNVMHNNTNFLRNLDGFIERTLISNFQAHREIDKIEADIEKTEESKKKILAQTDGLSEEQLMAAYHDISTWFTARFEAENRSKILANEIEKHKTLLDGYKEEYKKISQDSVAALYGRTDDALNKIMDAFNRAKSKNRRDFLDQLETTANDYLEMLNKGDFRGSARIVEKPDESAEIVLVDVDGTRIYNPNTALKTTMYMSLLFAVSKLTTIKHDDDYPLIFDAPTSSFTAAKESDFFSVVGEIQKQTIIVTKSFLKEKEDNKSILVLDKERLQAIPANKYRIEKKTPFDDRDLSTIQTTVTRLD